ncbi:MAG: DUF362 domain-containing protein [Verrucomicrobia bacterium]|nr:DUF362 domain-containing protein [Verrucomicrobiota bacterium]
MKTTSNQTRRGFLRTSLFGGLAAVAGSRFAVLARAAEAAPKTTSRVALMAGGDGANNAFRGLKVFEKEIARAIGDRRVILKPNNVVVDVPLCATHANCLEGILEFLKTIGKLQNTVIAESAANGPAIEGFTNYGYTKLADKYGVKMLDLDEQPIEIVHVFDEKDFRPHAVRMSKLLLDRNNFIISAAKLKTHDRVVATLSLKNIVFGAPIKDPGFRWGKACKPGAKCDKPIAHGSGFRALNFNLFALAPRLHPHLSVIDGQEGMEGNGPVRGMAVDHKVCVVSPDWLAADRTAVELMGIDFAKIGYLNFCAQAGMGEADLSKIEFVGESPAKHTKTYKLADNVEKQLIWMTPPKWES